MLGDKPWLAIQAQAKVFDVVEAKANSPQADFYKNKLGKQLLYGAAFVHGGIVTLIQEKATHE